jgi:DNA-binding CsgD family transcriptional regulator
MDQAAAVRAVEVLMSPLAFGAREAWLAECLRAVRAAGDATEVAADAETELESRLHMPGDTPGWLRSALDERDPKPLSPLPSAAHARGASLEVISLRCALAAGIATLHRLRSWRSALGQAFDDVDTGMAIFARPDHRELARNLCLDELLDEEPERERLHASIRQHAQSSEAGEGGARHDHEIELAGGQYRLVASRVAAGTLLSEPAVLVLVHRLTPGLPTTRELRVTFGLRGREPQVALLAAEGLSNAAIAERLRLSAHTVRHYLERVLERLGLHSRKALALHLMGTGLPRQQPRERRPT